MSDQNEPKTAPTPIAAADPHPTAALPVAGQVTAQTEAAPFDRPKPKSGPVRRVVAGILLVLSFILTPVAVTVGYVNVLIHDEGTYAEAVVPLATDPDVIAALQNRTVDALMAQVDKLDLDTKVAGWLAGTNLPPFVQSAIQAALGSLREPLEATVNRAVNDFLTSDAFPAIWEKVNRVAYVQAIAALDGTSALIDESGGLSLELNPLLAAVQSRLVANGHEWAGRIPIASLNYSYQLADPRLTGQLQDYYTLAVRLIWLVVIVTAVVLLASILLPRDRWRGLWHTAVAALLGLVTIAVVLRFAVSWVAGSATGEQSPAARQALAAIVLSGLRDWLRVAAVVAVVLAVVGWLGGRFASGAGVPGASVLTWLRDPRFRSVRRASMAAAGALLVALLLFADLTSGWTIFLSVLLLLVVVVALIPAKEPVVAATDTPAPPTPPAELEVAGTAPR